MIVTAAKHPTMSVITTTWAVWRKGYVALFANMYFWQWMPCGFRLGYYYWRADRKQAFTWGKSVIVWKASANA